MFNARQFVNDSLFSDAHKDAYGFRPSQYTYQAWYAMSEAELVAERDSLYAAVEASIEEDRRAHQCAATRFEAMLAKSMADHGIDRATAIRWDMDAEGISERDVAAYGMDWYAYHHGLKYGYFGEGR